MTSPESAQRRDAFISKLAGTRDFDGVVGVMTARNALFFDKIADVYIDAWGIATEPDALVARRPVAGHEKELSLDGRRHVKALRRLGILAFVDGYIQPLLEHEQQSDPRNTQPPLVDLYHDSLAQIAEVCGVTSEEIAQRKHFLEANRYARPWFLETE